MPEYSHTLIPDSVEFVPDPKQVESFLTSLVAIGAAPLQPALRFSKPSGEVRTGINPFTRQPMTLRSYKWQTLKDRTELSGALRGLDDYMVTVEGKGPPHLPAFTFDFAGSYDFLVRCRLQPEIVSTSDPHDEIFEKHNVELFGEPCRPTDRLGIFQNPDTLKIIEVPNAGCARYYIEFEFGKMLFPRIEDRLDIIEPRIVEVAEKDFGIKFVEGCHWCA